MSASTPPPNDSTVPSDRLWLRSELMGTQVITRDTGRRLGVVGEVVVDIDRREVVALGLRDNPLTRFLPGLPRWMPLERIRQVGDVILVDSSDSLAEGFDPERFSKVINCQVITESGQALGRVLGYSFDIETGELITLVIGALGVPLLAEGVLSTWELPVSEVVSSGSDRIIVYEGAEQKLKQLGTGLLEKMGIGGSSWEKEERERYRMGPVPAENQLPAGQVSPQEQRRIQPASARAFQPEEEMEYVELEERRQREPMRQRRYLDDETPRDSYGEREPYGRESYPERGSSGRPPFDERASYPDRPPAREWDQPREEGWRERDVAPRSYPPEFNGAAPSNRGRDLEERLEPERQESAERRRPAAEPVDVEPEILDDPW
ncbi:MAG: PRC-barrel domain-containing protein [Cyanobium sp.]